MNDLEEKFWEKEYELLKSIKGKDKADKAFEKTNYPYMSVGYAVLKRAIIDFYKSNPRRGRLIAAVLVLIVIFAILNSIYIWI